MARGGRLLGGMGGRVIVAGVVLMAMMAWVLGVPAAPVAQARVGSTASPTEREGSQGPAVEAQEVHTVWTAEFGVARPRGLAYDPSRGEFLVAGDARQGTRVLRLGPDEGRRGSVVLPRLAEPSTLAFDPLRRELTAIDDAVRVEVPGRALTAASPPVRRVPIDGLGLDAPLSAAFDADIGTWFVLEERTGTVVLVDGKDLSSVPERFAVPGGGAPQVIAFNPADDLLYVMDAQGSALRAVDRAGEVQKTVSVESTDLSAPVAMVFAPSTDPTDDPDAQHLFVADSGGDATLGGVTELSLTASAVAAASVDSATLVQTIDTSSWVPASPDPAGIVWMRGADELAVVDSEVDETTGAGWNNVNLWRSTRTGDVAGVGALWGSNSAGSYSKEPTGLGYDDARNILFVSDDSAGKIFVVRRGGDGVFGTSDDVVGSIDAEGYGSTDTEDPEFDPTSGHLFFLDGRGREIYRVDPVDTTWGNADDVMTHFDISHLGPADFEGLSSNPGRGTLFVGARTTEEIYEITFDGTLVRRIDVPVSQMRYISGLGVAPASNGSGQTNLWIVDRAVDNGADPNENDGKIFEIAARDIGAPRENAAPVVESVGVDQSSPRTDDTVSATVTASDGDGDTLTYGYQWVNDGVDIVGATSATLDLSVAGSGEKGDEIAVRVTASDGLATSDPVTSSPVTVADSPPVFDQDLADRSSREGDAVSLSAAATDPDGDALTYAASGLPAGVTVDASTGAVSGTVADGAAANSPYVVSITVRDGATVDATDTFTWTVTAASPGNAAPVVDAGADRTVSPPATSLDLDGTVTDDGQPDPPGAVTTTWSKASGPGTVSFGDASAVDTTASFSDPGTYVLRLTADDGELTSSDELSVTVESEEAPTQTLQLRITGGRDDAEEAASGSVSYNNGDLELVEEKSLQTVGLRFPGVAVPHGATIVSGTVQFKADETDEVATDLTFRAQAADNAPTFATDAHNISSRPLTAAWAAWSPAPWTTVGAAGPDQETSDISAVIQEVVDRPGWASGNALVLVVTGSGKRVAESYNGDAAGAPLLELEYAVSGQQRPQVDAGPNATVALPDSAALDGTVTDDGLPDPPDAVTTTWSKASGPGTVSFGDASAVDTTASFSDPGTYVLRLTADDGELSANDTVTITASAAGTQTVESRVAASTDDAEEDATGDIGISSSDLELVQESTVQTVGLRFPGLAVPHGVTIVSATVQLKADETDEVATDLTFRAQAADNAPTFNTDAHNISSRPLTAASAAWSPTPWTTVGAAGPDQETSDISAVIQAVVDRPGWASGNALVLVVTGSGKRVAESYNGDAAGAPLLRVTYSVN